MRYYEIWTPSANEPIITSNVRDARDLPDGTRVYATFCERDGGIVEQRELPVEGGRVAVTGRGKHRPAFT